MKNLLLSVLLFASFGLNAQTNVYSLEFDGVDDYVDLPSDSSSSFSNSDSFSILLWVKIGSNANCQAIAVKGDAGEWDYGIWKGCSPEGPSGNSGPLNSAMFGFGHNHHTFTNDSLSNTQWKFLSGTYNNGDWKIYVNGSLNQSYNGSIFTSFGGTFTLGRKGSFSSNYFEGKIDDISLWNYDLDSTEIAQYMLCPPNSNEAGLVGYWNFEEGTGTTTADQTSGNNNGVLSNGVAWNTDVPTYNCATTINELDNSLIKLFPNPSDGIITLALANHLNGQIVITDVVGKEVLRETFNSNQVQVDIATLESKGVYFAKVLNSGGDVLSVKKFIYQ
jgi:hypothetical protein